MNPLAESDFQLFTKYISRRKANYKPSTPECLYSSTFDTKRYYCEKTGMWHRCRSCYCNIHGLINRQIKSAKAEKRLEKFTFFLNCNIHYGGIPTIEQRNKCFTQFKKLMFKHYPACDIVKINHWKYNKKTKGLLLHHHFTVGSHEIIARRVIKRLLTEAAIKVNIAKPTKVRLGYKADSQV